MNGDWGEEERDLERDFPFSPDQTFELVITVKELGYTVMYTQYSDQSQKCSFYLFTPSTTYRNNIRLTAKVFV